MQVLRAVDFNKITIDVLCIEANGFDKAREQTMIEHLEQHGFENRGFYDLYPLNLWFVRKGFVPSAKPGLVHKPKWVAP